MKKRNCNIDSVRLACNLMVVLFHSYPFMYFVDKSVDWHVMRYVVYYLGDVFLPTLFLMSGWLFFSRFDLSQCKRKFVSRLKRLVVPYICWCALYIGVYYVFGFLSPRARLRFEGFHLNGICDVLSAILPFTNMSPDPALWFIRALLILAVVSPIIYLVFRFCPQILIGCMLLTPIVLSFIMPAKFFGVVPYAWTCFFFGGYLAYKDIELCDFFIKKKSIVVAVGIAAVTAVFVMDSFCGIPADDCTIGFRDIELLLAAPLLMAISPALTRLVGHLPFRKVLIDSSFFIYCGHVFIVSCVVHGLGGMGISPWIILPAAFLAAITLLMCWWRIWKYLSPTTLRFFDGTL